MASSSLTACAKSRFDLACQSGGYARLLNSPGSWDVTASSQLSASSTRWAEEDFTQRLVPGQATRSVAGRGAGSQQSRTSSGRREQAHLALALTPLAMSDIVRYLPRCPSAYESKLGWFAITSEWVNYECSAEIPGWPSA